MVDVHMKDGTSWTGMLHTSQWETDEEKKKEKPTLDGICLKNARPRLLGTQKSMLPLDEVPIKKEDIGCVTAVQVDLYNDELTEAARRKGGEVLADTDIDIAGGRTQFGQDRELVAANAWLGDDSALEGGLAAAASGGGGTKKGWDQFAVNERMGGKSTYSEELYTTSISDKKFTKEQRAYAERMAREIEGKVTTNVHLAEERGQRELAEAMEGDMDEEDKYSMVLNNPRHNEAPAAGAAKPVDVSDGGAAKEGNGGAAAAPSAEGAAAPSAEAPSGEKASAPAADKPTASSKLRASAKEFVPGGFKPAGGAAPATPQGYGGGGGMAPQGYSPAGQGMAQQQYAAMAGGYGQAHPQGMNPQQMQMWQQQQQAMAMQQQQGQGYPAQQQQQQAAMMQQQQMAMQQQGGYPQQQQMPQQGMRPGGPMSPQMMMAPQGMPMNGMQMHQGMHPQGMRPGMSPQGGYGMQQGQGMRPQGGGGYGMQGQQQGQGMRPQQGGGMRPSGYPPQQQQAAGPPPVQQQPSGGGGGGGGGEQAAAQGSPPPGQS